MEKFNGLEMVPIAVPQVLQIAGRAGRFRVSRDDTGKNETSENKPEEPPAVSTPENVVPATGPLPPAPKTGYVTGYNKSNHIKLREAMITPVQPIGKARIQPLPQAVELFAQFFPKGTPLSRMIDELMRLARVSNLFEMADFDDQKAVADLIEKVDGLTMTERYKLCCAPVKIQEGDKNNVIQAFAQIVASGRSVTILDMPEIDLEALDEGIPKDMMTMARLESLHQTLMLYLWLRYAHFYFHFSRVHIFASKYDVNALIYS